MLKLIDLTYCFNSEYNQPLQLIRGQKEALGYVDLIKDQIRVEVIKHLPCQETTVINEVTYSFFRSRNSFWRIPFKTHAYVSKLRPDVILVQGLITPLQVIFLRLSVGKRCKILVQHHGEQPYNGIKQFFQKVADHSTDGYLFTAIRNAEPWVAKGTIPSTNKCFEVLEASTDLRKKNKQVAQLKLGVTGRYNFLWVGRLNANKDPLTVLRAFKKYRDFNSSAKLYMIFQENDLLNEVRSFIAQNRGLETAVRLIGVIPREDLADWYSAMDYYISASHKEGSGYALLESMACGCIPVVTDIPSFRKITANGKYGLLFKTGDANDLLEILLRSKEIPCEELSAAVQEHFSRELSFKAIADQLAALCYSIAAK